MWILFHMFVGCGIILLLQWYLSNWYPIICYTYNKCMVTKVYNRTLFWLFVVIYNPSPWMNKYIFASMEEYKQYYKNLNKQYILIDWLTERTDRTDHPPAYQPSIHPSDPGDYKAISNIRQKYGEKNTFGNLFLSQFSYYEWRDKLCNFIYCINK